MKKLMYVLFFVPMLFLAQENKGFILDATEITVKLGEEASFIQGVKAWKECYLENNGDDKWNMWRRIQGEGSVYIITGRMANWAEFDAPPKDANKECYHVVMNLIMPHVEKIKSSIARSIPDWGSSEGLANTGLVWVTYFKVNNSNAFSEVVGDVGAAMVSQGENRPAYWYRVIGGDPEDADYFISNPYEKFSDLDMDEASVWEVYEKEHGKKKMLETRDKLRGCLDDAWSYLYKRMADLSN